MNILKEYKGIVSLLTNTVNEAGKLDEISLKNSTEGLYKCQVIIYN
jgi:hypothetical protein